MIPKSLKLLSSHDTGGGCYAASFQPNGKLLIGCHDGIRIFSDDNDNADKKLKSAHITSVRSIDENDSVFIMHRKDERKVGKLLPDFKSWEQIFVYKYPGHETADMAVSTKFAVASAANSLVAYNLATKAKVTNHLGFQPWRLRFDYEENLYIASSNTLYKYSMDEHGELIPIWTCEEIVGPGGIAFTKYGDVVVQNINNPEIFIVSPQGLFLFILTYIYIGNLLRIGIDICKKG